MPTLNNFSACKTWITDIGVEHVKNVGIMDTIRLNEARVTDLVLTKWPALLSVRNLSLWRCAITDAGLVHIAKLPTLERLSLDETSVTGAGVR